MFYLSKGENGLVFSFGDGIPNLLHIISATLKCFRIVHKSIHCPKVQQFQQHKFSIPSPIFYVVHILFLSLFLVLYSFFGFFHAVFYLITIIISMMLLLWMQQTNNCLRHLSYANGCSNNTVAYSNIQTFLGNKHFEILKVETYNFYPISHSQNLFTQKFGN